ncbi:MAG: PAS domain-containing protein [Candidatus Saccharimonadales bacterium]
MASEISSMVFIQYLTTVFDNIHDAILLIGVEPNNTYRLLMANEEFNRGTGHTAVEIGKTIQQVTLPKTYEKLIKRYQTVVKSKKRHEFIEEYDVPMGKQTYEVQLIPIFNSVGTCTQIACITRNITELYRLQERLKETAETLEQVSHELRQTI